MDISDDKILDALAAAHLDRAEAARALGVSRAELVAFLEGGSRGKTLARVALDRLRDELARRATAVALEALADPDTKVRLKALEATLKRLGLDSAPPPEAAATGVININIKRRGE